LRPDIARIATDVAEARTPIDALRHVVALRRAVATFEREHRAGPRRQDRRGTSSRRSTAAVLVAPPAYGQGCPARRSRAAHPAAPAATSTGNAGSA
jgi:hypothetical protein